jgi:hypothetical protein
VSSIVIRRKKEKLTRDGQVVPVNERDVVPVLALTSEVELGERGGRDAGTAGPAKEKAV